MQFRKLFYAKIKSYFFLLTLILFSLSSASQAIAQPYPPVNIVVTSRAANNLLNWAHNPNNPPGFIANYQICRSTTYGATVPIATVAATTVSFSDNTAGYSYGQEFYYTLRSISTTAITSPHSEQVMRFLPKVGLTDTGMQINTEQTQHSGSWNPYPGEWTDTYIYIRTTPEGGTAYGGGDYAQRQIIRATRSVSLPVGGPYYYQVGILAPDWWGSPANRRYVSYSSSLPFYVYPESPYEDNASSTYFNSSQNRVMAEPLSAGGAGTTLFQNSGGNFWRIRKPIAVTSHVNLVYIPVLGNINPAKINAPCRAAITGIPVGQITTSALAQVRVANQYGEELPCIVFNEVVSGGSVTSFDVHFLANQDQTTQEIYWIYWGNPSASAPNYGAQSFKNSFIRTSQFDYSPWYSRRLMRGGVETHSTAAGARLITNPPSPADDLSATRLLAFSFPYFDMATTTVNVSTNGYISFPPHSQPMNTMTDFIGPNSQRFIAPFWCNLMVNSTVPTNAGLFYENLTPGTAQQHRALFTWRANRFNSVNEDYIFQAALYRMGDIAFRYDTLNYNALFQTPSGSGDNPINVAPEHTAGISATDGNRWLGITDDSRGQEVSPLKDGSGRNIIHYLQSCHGWTINYALVEPTNSCAMAGPTCVGNYDSRIFDGRSTAPTWTNLEYDITGAGAIDLYVRTSPTTAFPAWAAGHLISANLTAGSGVINLTLPTNRYVQYRVVFKKSNVADNPVLRRIKFSVGYVLIDNTTNQYNNADVSQGQTFLASMTYSNFYSNPVNTITASLTFTAGAVQTWFSTTPLPVGVPSMASTTIGYQVTVDPNSGNLNNWTYINGYLEAGDGIATLSSSAAISSSYYRIRPKANLQIDWVATSFDKVNKGQGGIPVQMQISNTSPQVPFILNNASLTFTLGQYSIDPEFTINPLDQGLFGVYYNTTTANPPPFPAQNVAGRVDSTVNFNWGAVSPIPGVVTTDYFAVRWSGYVTPDFSQDYTFYSWADDGTRLWVNGQLIINSWAAAASERTSKTISLTAGVPVEIILETFELTGNSRSELRWSSSSVAKSIIPSDHLKPSYIPVVHSGQPLLINYTVAVQPSSPSGVAYINSTASATNGWVPGLLTDDNGASVIDSWIIQSPASLAIGLINAPEIVYRGQANVPVDVEILNIGEADALIASIPLLFTLGSYTDIIPGELMPVTLSGGESRFIKVLVSILENTPTGTAWIDAEVYGSDVNTGVNASATGAAEPGQWQILAEKILSYKDPSHLYASTAFARPDSVDIGVYAMAENLVPLREYAIRWYDASGSEIVSDTTIGFSDPSGKLSAEWKITPTTDYGLYTVKITNPVNTYSPSQTSFRVVTSASVSASLSLPAKVSVGQTFPGYMEILNNGGADATGMVPEALSITGPGTANLITGPTPPSAEVAGNSIATISYSFTATAQGNYMISAGANGFDASSDSTIQATASNSNICQIQTSAAVSIIGLIATPTIVYRDQRNIEVLMTLQNNGQADARISLADLRSPPNNALSFATFTLASPTLPVILPGNSTATYTFRVNINAAATLGLASMTARIQYRDINNPVTLFTVINKVYSWTINSPTITCYADNTFLTARYAFNEGATVYPRASGLPTNTDVRIRFYETTEPFPPTGIGVGALTPLNTGPTGIVSHPGHTIPIGTDKLNQWLVIVDDGDDFSVGNIFAMQFFDVYRLGTYTVTLSLASSTCYAGDLLNAAVTVTNNATWPTNVRHNLNTFNQTYAPNSAGSMNRITLPALTLPFPSGASYTYNITMQAALDSGLNGSSTLRMPGSSWRVFDDSQGGGTIWYTPVTDAISPITIYRKGLRLQTMPLPAALPGLRGEYYNTVVAPPPMPTGDPLYTGIDSTVNFSWATNPATGINADYFAVRWSGFVTPDFSQTYTFYTRTDDGRKLWVNGVQLTGSWVNQGTVENSGNIALTAGVPVPIVMEYYENTGTSIAQLSWKGTVIPAKEIIPSTKLSYTPYLSPIWDFGIVEPGSTSAKLQNQLTNTGNYDLQQVKLARVDLRKSVTETISGSYLQTEPPMPLTVSTNASITIDSMIQIPFHQAPGVYVATMAIYEDHNFSNTLEVTNTSKEPHNLIMARVEVKAIAKAMLVNNSIDLGVIEPGGTSNEQQLEYVGVGNSGLTDLKFDDMSADGIYIDPLIIGPLAYNGYGTASISVTILATQTPGVYYATGTLRDDIPGGAIDTFVVKWAVGSQALDLNPWKFTLGLGTPTYQIPAYPSTITNTGELPLNKLFGISTVFKNIDQAYTIATDNVSLTSPSAINIMDSEPAQAIVYVPGGKATGTYIATFTWHEDLNNNAQQDSFEAYDNAIASFVIMGYHRLYSLNTTEDFGGVKPDTTKTISVGIRNAGSLTIPKVKFVVNSLSDGVDPFDAANIVIPAFLPDVIPGELRYFNMSAAVPLLHKHGVFVGIMTIYGDLDDNGACDLATEPWCEVKLRIEIGDQQISITSPANVLLSGTAASTTPALFVTAKNTGSLALTSVRVQGTELIPQVAGPSIASSAFQFLPSSLVGSLIISQSRSFSTRVLVPFAQPSGIYDGYIWTWEDANTDGIRQTEETTASVPVQLTVSYVKTLQTTPTSINFGLAARGDVATSSFIAQNIGNTSLIDARWETNILTGPTPIAATNITITPDPIGFMATPPAGLPVNEVSTLTLTVPVGTSDGPYIGTMVFYEDDTNPVLDIYDTGVEPYFNMPVSIQITTPFISVTGPIALPASDPVGRTASATFSVSNTGSITFKNLRYSVSNLINGANQIASSAIIVLPGAFSPLNPGGNQTAEISANISPATSYPPGTYSGTFTIYDDRNYNSIRDAHESVTITVVSVVVKVYPSLNILPANINAGKIARNAYSNLINIGFQNVGNAPLNGLTWATNDLSNASGSSIPTASYTFTFMQPEPIAVGALATAQLKIGRISPLQGLSNIEGIYGPAQQFLQAGAAIDSVFIQCEIIPGGPQGLASGSVWQEIATASFAIAPVANPYILSAYVCPGTGTARIGFLLTNETGDQTGYSGVEINAAGNLTPFGASGGVTDTFYQDYGGIDLPWYRVYLHFNYGFDSATASKTYILLQNCLPGGHTTWFDGIQLEKASPGQDGPTSWAENNKLLSPTLDKDLSGNKGYYQW